jgi:hypothetical protein
MFVNFDANYSWKLVQTYRAVRATVAGLQIEGVLAYFMHLKCQKRIGDDVGDLKCFYQMFFCENDPPDTFYPTYYARI